MGFLKIFQTQTMKNTFAFSLLFFLHTGVLHAQSVVIAADGNKLSLMVRVTTTEAQLQKADSVFAAHGVTVDFKTNRKDNLIREADVTVQCDKGSATYHATKESLEQSGLTILVDRNKDAKVSLCVGVCNSEK